MAGHDNEALFTLWSDNESGAASGTIVAYAGLMHYRISFTDVIAADDRNPKILPTPIVVMFPAAIHVDSAYVGSLDGECAIHEPWESTKSNRLPFNRIHEEAYPGWSAVWSGFLANADRVQPIPAPAGDAVDSPLCSKPSVDVHTTGSPPTVVAPDGTFVGQVVIRLHIADDGTIVAARIERSSHLRDYDRIAANAALSSKFAPRIYRCRPVSDSYLFVVEFEGRR